MGAIRTSIVTAILLALSSTPAAAALPTPSTDQAALSYYEANATTVWSSRLIASCPGGVDVAIGPLQQDGRIGETRGCDVTLDAAAWNGTSSVYGDHYRRSAYWCTAVAHEYGHAALGPDYFRDVNPSDPAHSPDPQSLMFARETVVAPGCELRTEDYVWTTVRRFRRRHRWVRTYHYALVDRVGPVVLRVEPLH